MKISIVTLSYKFEVLGFDEDKHCDIELQIDVNAEENMNMSIVNFVDMCVLLAEV